MKRFGKFWWGRIDVLLIDIGREEEGDDKDEGFASTQGIKKDPSVLS